MGSASAASYDVYILAGQSNMDGRGDTNQLTGAFSFWRQTQTNVLIYYKNHYVTGYTPSWQTLKPGFSEDNGALTNTFGPELSIGYVLANAAPGRNIALIKVSRGGSNLYANWNPDLAVGGEGGVMYQDLTNGVPAALQALTSSGHTYTVRGLLWHQGEADTTATNDYRNELTNFVAAVRRDLNLPNLPFVIGEINRDNPDPGYALIRQAQYAASQTSSNAYFVTAMGLPSDGLHFYTTAVIGLGQRFGSQAAAFLPGPLTTQTWDQAGNGTWSTNSARWTTDGGVSHHAWSNGNHAAVFVSTGGATVTVSNGVSAYGVTIATNATGYIFAGGTLTNGNGGIIANESTSLGNSLNVGGLQTWCVATGKTLTATGSLNLSIHTLNIAGDGTTALAGAISDVGNDPTTNSAFLFNSSVLLKTGNGALMLLNSNNFTGATQIRGGSLQLGDGALRNGVILGNIENNATLVFANPLSQTHTGVISGTGLMIKTGLGTLSLTGSNTFSGGTVINGGTVSISADRHLGNFGTLSLDNGGMLQVAGTNDSSFEHAVVLRPGGGGFDVNATGNNLVASGPMSGSGGLTKSGPGTLTIANAPVYTGNTSVQQGTLNLAASPLNASLNVAAGASVVLGPSSGLMGEYYRISPLNVSNTNPNFVSLTALNSHFAGAAPSLWSLSTAAGTNFDFAFSGSGPTKFPNPLIANASDFEVRWTGKFNAPSAGTYTFSTTSDDGSMLWIDGSNVVSNNAFQGLTTRSGTLSLSAGLHDIVVAYYQGNNTYGFYVDVILPGGSSQRLPTSLLQFGATAFAIGPLSGDVGSSLNLSNYPLAISQTTDGTFGGTISGAGSLTKVGAGELTLNGSNTFTGSTTVNAGTLTLDYRTQNNNKISTDAALLLNGATLKILGHASTLFTQRVSGLVLMANVGASTVVNQSGNTVLDFTSGNLSLGSGVSVNFRTTGGAGVRLPGTTNTLFGPWAIVDTGDPAFLNANNFVVPLTNYDGVLPAAGADPAKNYLNTVGTVTNSETANLLNFRDAPSLSISNGAMLHLNFGLLFPGLTALSINGGGQLGASNATLVINTSASLDTNALTIGALISAGSGALSKLGPGTLIVTNNNTYTGGTTISAGTLQVGNGGNRGTLGSGSVTDNGTLVYNRSDAVAITNSITGNGVLLQAGTNTLSINTPQSYAGGTIVNNGIILLNTPDQNRALAFNSAVTVNAGGSLYITNVNNVQNDESWTLNGGLVKIVGGGHQHFGSITLNGGTLTTGPGSFAYDGTAGNYAIDGNVTVTGTAPSTLDANTGINLGALVAGGVAVTFNVADVTGDGSPDLLVTTRLRDKDGGGARGVIKTGTGTMLISAACDYTGTTTLSNGVLLLGHALAAQNSTVSNLVSGGLAFSSTNVFTIGGLTGNGDIALSNASGAVTLNVGNNGLSTRYDGRFKGSGALTKIGGGMLTLGGVSTYTGVATISNGTLALTGSGSAANSSTIIIVSNATLDVTGRNGGAMTLASGQTMRGSGSIKGNLIVANGSTLSPGTSVGTLTCSNSLTVGNAATLQYELGNSSDRTVVLGNLTLGGTLNINDAGGFTNGIYTLFTYGGTLTYNGVAIGTRPGGSFDYSIDTNTAGQVKLSVTNSVVLDPFTQWQLQYFGCTNCAEAAPTADVTGTGQNNLFKYVAGLDPTNPASVFVLQIASVTGQPSQQNLLYNPVAIGRTYTVQFNTGMLTNGWSSLGGYGGPVTNGSQVTVTDLNATQTNKFYRVSITLP